MTVNDIQRNVNIEKINFYLGYKINNEEEMKEYVKKLITLYEETLPFGKISKYQFFFFFLKKKKKKKDNFNILYTS